MDINLNDFHRFFDCCVGQWVSERTYHYVSQGEIERSRTTFQVEPLSPEGKQQVLADNHATAEGAIAPLAQLPGFRLGFHTVSETGETVSQTLQMLFVPHQQTETTLEGNYLRDRAYEEDKPIIAHFCYRRPHRELLMTTPYTRVTSVDSITLVNPTLRLRRILNYQRPAPEGNLDTLLLAGFGVEQKVTA
jgi:hypothetical protein